MLQYLTTVARGPAQRFEVLAQLVSSLFDLNPSMATHLKTSLWKKCVINLLEMLKVLQDNPNIKVGPPGRLLGLESWQGVARE